jgi:hypothetical protein
VHGKHESSRPIEDPDMKSPPVYKQMVRLFQPGSIFPSVWRKAVYGQVVQVGQLPGRTVWHSGLALGVAAKIGVKHV